MAEEKNQYSIGKVSTLCNVPVRTLRYYDKIGLLVPSHRKDDNHYRYYSQEQLLTLFIIRKLKLLGIPLKEVREIVCGQDTAAMTRSIQARLEEILRFACAAGGLTATGHGAILAMPSRARIEQCVREGRVRRDVGMKL